MVAGTETGCDIFPLERCVETTKRLIQRRRANATLHLREDLGQWVTANHHSVKLVPPIYPKQSGIGLILLQRIQRFWPLSGLFLFFGKLGQSSTRTHPAEAKPQRAVSCSCKQPRAWAGISSRELLGAAYRAWTQQELLCCLYLCMCSTCREVLVAYARAKPIPSKCMGLVNRSAIAFPTGIPETVFPPWDVLTRLREVSGCLVL